MAGVVIEIPVDRLHLYEENPRHGHMTDSARIIEYLCQDEQVFELARSIVEHNTNPLELIGVVRLDDVDDAGEPAYEVWEGNRRVCAIMLLNDPDKAPVKWRKRFRDLASGFDGIDMIDGRVFDNREELKFWMRNIHNGVQGGRGRKPWGADEQHRDNPTKKNAIAFDLLERAQRQGLLTKEQRVNKITTLQRFVGGRAFKDLVGADDRDPSNVTYTRGEGALSKLLKVIIADLKNGTINSRAGEEAVEAYACSLEERAGLGSPRDVDAGGLPTGGGSSTGGKPYDTGGEPSTGGGADGRDSQNPPKSDDGDVVNSRPKVPAKVKVSKDLKDAIESSKNDKLASLYYSITKVSAQAHAPLVTVGCWSLCETISRMCGSRENASFDNFFNANILQNKLGLGKRDSQTIVQALGRLGAIGNATKHHHTSANYDHRTLVSDMEVMSPMLAKALTLLPKENSGREDG